MQASRPTCALLVLLLVACELPTTGYGTPIGVVTLTSQMDEGAYRVSAFGEFYGLTWFAPNFFATDTCHFIQSVEMTGGPVLGDKWRERVEGGATVLPLIDAGSFVEISTPARTDSLRRAYAFGERVGYGPSTNVYLDAAPGDSVTIVVPGAREGFPSAEIGLRVVEPYVLDTLPTPLGESALDVRWDAPTHPGSRMIVILRFSSDQPPHPTPSQNTMLACSFPDTGAAQVPAADMFYFRNSYEHLKHLTSARIRFARRDLGKGVSLHAISHYFPNDS